MAQTRFSAGDRVAITRSVGFAAPSGQYREVTALPRDAGPQQYRVRSDGETFDRVVDEVRLESALRD